MLSSTAKAPFATWSGVPNPSPREPAARALTNATSATRSLGPLPSYGPLKYGALQFERAEKEGEKKNGGAAAGVQKGLSWVPWKYDMYVFEKTKSLCQVSRPLTTRPMQDGR